MRIVAPRENGDYNSKMDPAYYNYTDYQIPTGDIENYRICQKMGRGKYSEVFEGHSIPEKSTLSADMKALSVSSRPKKRVVIKVLKPIRMTKVSREVMILKHLDHKSIIQLKDVVRDKTSDTHSLIFPYIKHKDTLDIFQHATPSGIRHYMRHLLEGLAYAHSRGIFHRDIKPQNLIVSKHNKQLIIIDWGLAEFYHPGQEYSVRVASKHYKAPELLVNYPYYDYAVDIWSFGCVLAEALFKKSPFFYSGKNADQISEIISLLGKRELSEYLTQFEIPFTIPADGPEERVPLASLVEENQRALYEEAIDLLEKVLVYDHFKRPTASECLLHPFFAHKD